MDAKERDLEKEPGGRIREEMDAGVRPARPWLLIIASLLLAGLALWKIGRASCRERVYVLV